MDPIFKWTGGKRREIDIFKDYFPNFIKNNTPYLYIEPFVGGGAVYWYLENKKNIINDIDNELVNFYKEARDHSQELTMMIENVGKQIDIISENEKNSKVSYSDAKKQRGEFFYLWRDKDRKNGLSQLTNLERAFRFLVVNQLSFNGMRRFNSRGEFNIPYGNYKHFNKSFTEEHINLLKKSNIYSVDYKDVILENDNDNVFIFLDPPYTREFKEYSHGNIFDNNCQIELSEVLKSLKKSNFMLIINKDEFTTNLYKNLIKYEYAVKYSTNIKNRFDNNVQHIIVTNY